MADIVTRGQQPAAGRPCPPKPSCSLPTKPPPSTNLSSPAVADEIVSRLRMEAAQCDLSPCDCQCPNLIEAADEIERLRAEVDLKGYRLDDALDEIERLRQVVDALVARPFRGTSLERRDRMYGSDWEAVHDALDALETRRG